MSPTELTRASINQDLVKQKLPRLLIRRQDMGTLPKRLDVTIKLSDSHHQEFMITMTFRELRIMFAWADYSSGSKYSEQEILSSIECFVYLSAPKKIKNNLVSAKNSVLSHFRSPRTLIIHVVACRRSFKRIPSQVQPIQK